MLNGKEIEQKADELLAALGYELGESRADYMEKRLAKEPIDRCVFKECPTCGHVDIEGCETCERCSQALDWGDRG